MKILHFHDKHSGLEGAGISRYRLFSSLLMAAGQAATCSLKSKRDHVQSYPIKSYMCFKEKVSVNYC